MNLLIKLHESQTNRQFGCDIHPPESRRTGEALKLTVTAAMLYMLALLHTRIIAVKIYGSRNRLISLIQAFPAHNRRILPPNQ